MKNRLQDRRVALGLTQPQVSEKLKAVEPRADISMVSRYEQGVCLPTRDQLSALEELYGAPRTELYHMEDLDLLDVLPCAEKCGGNPDAAQLCGRGWERRCDGASEPCRLRQGERYEIRTDEGRAERPLPPSRVGKIRKCYRISKKFAQSLPDDLLQVCGYSSWQSWHDAALKRLLGEYAARSRGMMKKIQR